MNPEEFVMYWIRWTEEIRGEQIYLFDENDNYLTVLYQLYRANYIVIQAYIFIYITFSCYIYLLAGFIIVLTDCHSHVTIIHCQCVEIRE